MPVLIDELRELMPREPTRDDRIEQIRDTFDLDTNRGWDIAFATAQPCRIRRAEAGQFDGESERGKRPVQIA
jgi:hypothetical protein